MSNFEELKAELKDKWLDFFEENWQWINKLSCWVDCTQTKDKRPNSKVILTAISLLEPTIIDYLIPLVDINTDGEQVVRTLGLDFRPQIELEKREEERTKQKEAEPNNFINPDTEYLNQFRN